jgi:hypothetical protein
MDCVLETGDDISESSHREGGGDRYCRDGISLVLSVKNDDWLNWYTMSLIGEGCCLESSKNGYDPEDGERGAGKESSLGEG